MTQSFERLEAPREVEAGERAWHVVSSAFAARERSRPRRGRRLGAAAALAGLAALLAASLSPPGRAVLRSVQEAVGVQPTEQALFSLPAPGRLLVRSPAGAWVVGADGSKRRLGTYSSVAWSPHGLYVVATSRNLLLALTPKGEERWSLARPAVREPRWAGTITDTRIAYVDRTGVRVVAGDGTGDHLLAPAESGPLAWRPGPRRQLAYVSASEVRLQDADSGRVLWRATRGPADPVTALSWSSDGTQLLVLTPQDLRIFDAGGRLVFTSTSPAGATNLAASFVPGSRSVALARRHGDQSDVVLLPRRRVLFRGTGVFADVVPSPDGRWLLVTWPTADQWVFVRLAGGQRLRAVANIGAQFGSRSFPRLGGWCCR